MNTTHRRLANLDVLRACAILLVVPYHVVFALPELTAFPEGGLR